MMGVFGERIFEILLIVIRKNNIKTNPTTMNEYTRGLVRYLDFQLRPGVVEEARERKAQKCIDSSMTRASVDLSGFHQTFFFLRKERRRDQEAYFHTVFLKRKNKKCFSHNSICVYLA